MIAILDTNAFLDLASCHDIVRDQNDALRKDYRMMRAGAALRLAIYLHETQATTAMHVHETMRKLERFAPPGANKLETDFVIVWTIFTKPKLLHGWHADHELSVPEALKGSQLDDALLDLAVRYGCPMISYEGYGHANPNVPDPRNRLQKQAARRGVQILKPEQFYRGKLKAPDVEGFMVNFHRRMPSVYKGQNGYEIVQAKIRDVYRYYSNLLHNTADPAEFE